MFTGLVEGRGTVGSSRPEGRGVRIEIDLPERLAQGVCCGDSLAINGCCLTVVDVQGSWLSFQVGPETLAKTNLGRLAAGDEVNLERPLAADGRIGGHFVQGHIDGLGTVESIDRDGAWVTIWFGVPESLAGQLVPKGSVAVEGVSLTVVDVEPQRFSVALIPHTLEVTTLGQRSVGDEVNIETDILAKYVQKLLSAESVEVGGTGR